MSDRVFLPLGELCSAAYYLRELGLRKAAYPFDWLFCGPQIVLDCLRTDFETLLNPSYIHKAREGDGAGHVLYHANLFRHKDAHTPEGLAYYQRTVQRFNAVMNGTAPVTAIVCMADPVLHEPPWRTGFAIGNVPDGARPGATRNISEWDAPLQCLRAKRPDINTVVIELERSYRESSWAAGLGLRPHSTARLTIRGEGGAPFTHPADDEQARELFKWITSDPKIFTEDVLS
jgi:hypothetical protein